MTTTEKKNALLTLLDSKRDRLASALPKKASVDWDLWTAGFLAAATDNPEIVQCCIENPQSVAKVAIECATLGLVPGSALGMFHLIPRRMKKRQRDGSVQRVLTLTYVIGYGGLMELAYRHERVELIQPVLVYATDHFFEMPAHPTEPIQHRRTLEGDRSDSSVIGGYCLAWIRDASRPVVAGPFPRDVFDALAKSSDSDAWASAYQSMCLKTLVRRIASRIPRSTELQRAIHAEAVTFNGQAGPAINERTDEAASPSYSVVASAMPELPPVTGPVDLDLSLSADPDPTGIAMAMSDNVADWQEEGPEPAEDSEPPQPEETDSLTGERPPTTWTTKVQRPSKAREGDLWLKERTGEWFEMVEGDWRKLAKSPQPEVRPSVIVVLNPPAQGKIPDTAPDGDCAFFCLRDGNVWRFVSASDEWEVAKPGTAAYSAVEASLRERYAKEAHGEEAPPSMSLAVIAQATIPF